MKIVSPIILTVCIGLLSGCAHFNCKYNDIEVDAQTDSKANMSAYTSYSWLGAMALLNDPTNKWQPPEMDIAGDIKYLIDRELHKKGINSDPVNPELAVAYFIGINMDAMQLKDDPDTAGDVLENIPQGALVVALINVETGYVVWLGLAKANIKQGASAELVRERIDYAVSNMFKLLK